MADNLRIWNRVERTDPSVTKRFDTGSFRGTAISTIYNVKRATEIWGPIGIGWGFTVADTHHITDEKSSTSIYQVLIRLWYMDGDKRGEVEHYGATKLAYDATKRRVVDEDAAKKAITDALSKALSLLGFSADVHMGKHDDQSYLRTLQHDTGESETQTRPPSATEYRTRAANIVLAMLKLEGRAPNTWSDKDRAELADAVESLCDKAGIKPRRVLRDIPEADLPAFIAAAEQGAKHG